jgi:hypothetical protein
MLLNSDFAVPTQKCGKLTDAGCYFFEMARRRQIEWFDFMKHP